MLTDEFINLNLYRVFLAVAKEKNISKAAKKLYISQPAVSKSLKKLEEELNTTLFKRSINGVELTEKGKILYFYADKAYKELLLASNYLINYKSIQKKEVPSNWCAL